MVDKMFETPGSSGVGRQHIDEPLGENLPAAEHRVKGKAPCADKKSDTPSRKGEVSDLAAIAASNRRDIRPHAGHDAVAPARESKMQVSSSMGGCVRR
ncbi:hypothetical protein ASC96_29490 [Rhizobium sp. Root1204]|nr:hypothetical protein ASC96_29490 [Rhizobium sp. Root1204]